MSYRFYQYLNFAVIISSSFANNRGRNKTVSEILDELLMEERYDSRLRPHYEGNFFEYVSFCSLAFILFAIRSNVNLVGVYLYFMISQSEFVLSLSTLFYMNM